jgi:hypothetical protein
LLATSKPTVTATPTYTVLSPWRDRVRKPPHPKHG